MPEPRDNQRSKVYKWDTTFRGSVLTLAECETLINKVCNAYGMRTPKIKDGRGTKRARGGARFISLPVWSRCVGIVLHEVSHSILAVRHQKEVAAHGPEFARLMLELVVRFGGHDRKDMVANAKKFKVKLAPRDKVPEPTVQVRAAARFKDASR